MRFFVRGVILPLLLAGCADGAMDFSVSTDPRSEMAQNVTIVPLSTKNIRQYTRPIRSVPLATPAFSTDWDYKVGTGDVLSIVVFDHPELTMPVGSESAVGGGGFRVQSDGTFFYPFIGQVAARGRVPEDIRKDISLRLAEYIPEPQVDVRVAQYNSQRVVVAGEVKLPNRQPLTSTPLTLIEAINAAGGFTDLADTMRVYLERKGRVYQIDLETFLENGAAKSNPVLRAGDIVTVASREPEEAFLLGEIGQPAAVDLSENTVTLTQALTRQGGLDSRRADARGVFVFRAEKKDVVVFQLNARSPGGYLLGTKFVLHPNDVVYVARSPLQRWNDTITQLLPTVSAIIEIDEAADAFQS